MVCALSAKAQLVAPIFSFCFISFLGVHLCAACTAGGASTQSFSLACFFCAADMLSTESIALAKTKHTHIKYSTHHHLSRWIQDDPSILVTICANLWKSSAYDLGKHITLPWDSGKNSNFDPMRRADGCAEWSGETKQRQRGAKGPHFGMGQNLSPRESEMIGMLFTIWLFNIAMENNNFY